MNKYCLPTSSALKDQAIKTFKDNFYDKYNADKLSDYITDLINAWQVMLICIGAAFILGFIYLLLVRCFAGAIVWLTIISIFVILAGGGYWVYHLRNNYDEAD